MALLDVSRASKRYGDLLALDGIDLAVEAGRFHGLIGPNGSGKSTLLKCIAGAEIATDGEIRLDGTDITGMPGAERARRGLSIKFQITSVLNALTVYDNMLLSLQAEEALWPLVRSRTRRELDDRVMEMLARFRLEARTDELAGVLSHGEQQWLEIAMALARDPVLVLLDEPTAGMSPEERRATGELLEPLRGQAALLIVEHDLDFIKDLCDVITVLDQGRLLDQGTPQEIENSERVKDVYVSRI